MENIITIVCTSVITFFTCELLRGLMDKLGRKGGRRRK